MRRALTPRHPRYAIVRRLGTGGMGSVYLARDRLDGGREVALKVCHYRVAPDQILREFHLLRELEHSGISRAYDFGRLPADGRTYFTLEYVAGPNLEKQSAVWRSKDRRSGNCAFLRVFRQIAAALAYLHRRELLHLDIKPANIVLAEGRAKLIDFGLFQLVPRQETRRPRGTAYYTAPEVFAGRAIDPRTDLYSLGVTFYRSLTGRYPFGGRSVDEIADRHQNVAPPSLKDVPADLASVVLKLLAKSPRQRFQSANELLDALRAVAPQEDGEESEPAVERPAFVGRRSQLDELFGWLEGGAGLGGRAGTEGEAGESSGRVLLVEGGSGVGKSRFVEVSTTEFLAAGYQVLSAGSPTGTEFEGVARLLEQVSILRPPSRAERERFSFLFTRFGISDRKAARREIARLELEQIRTRALQDAIEYVDVALNEPTVFVLEDIHFADGQTLEFVRRLAADGGASGVRAPLRILATGRPSLPVRDLARVDGVLCTELPPLSREQVREALQSVCPPPDRKSVTRLIRASRGNPGLLVQLLRNLRRGETPASTSTAADEELREMLVERVRHLDGPSQTLVLLLTLLRVPAGERLLRNLARLTPRVFAQAREDLLREGLAYAGRDGLIVAQDILGEPASELFEEVLVREGHERIASVLIATAKTRHQAAYHLLRAGQVASGVELAVEAADALETAGRVDEAATLLEEALASDGDGVGDRRRSLIERLGDLRERSGHFDAAAKCYGELLGDTEVDPVERVRILRKRGGVFQRQGDGARARELFDAALQRLESVENFDEHLHVLNELAALHLFSGEFALSTTFANRGLEMLRSVESDRLDEEQRAVHGLNLHSISGHILLRQFEYERAAEELQRSLENAERVGALSNRALILNNLGIAYHQANRLDPALEVYRQAGALAKRMGDDTALFSVQCNLATIRARLGEIETAIEILDEVEEMPHHRRSRRARLFYLHSRGLVERLQLRDARGVWEESVQLADELPDPLFAAYERLYLFENELDQGRWGSARELLGTLRQHPPVDAGFSRALDLRHAHLESLCGRSDTARALLAEHIERFEGDVPQMPSYAELWDTTRAACVLMELAEPDRAEALLTRIYAAFERSRQPPGTLECSLLLAELALRKRDAEGASEQLRRARGSLAKHDTSQASRASNVRVPFLEVRTAMLSSRRSRHYVEDRLVGTAGDLVLGGSQEVGWLLELVAAEHGVTGARRRVRFAREKFVSEVHPDDRASYLARDHRRRLGLVGGDEATTALKLAQRGTEALASHRWVSLSRLRDTTHPTRALEVLLEGCGASRAAIFVDDSRRVVAWRGPERERSRRLDELRRSALAAGSGPLGDGHLVEIPRVGGRAGVLYVEWAPTRRAESHAALEEFLPLAVRVLAPILGDAKSATRVGLESTPTLHGEMTRTHSFRETPVVASESGRMQEVLTLLRRTKESALPVLLTGESGVGKDHLARWVHALSPRRDGPFLGQDCIAIPEGLLEADLFGYEKGAFTDARQSRRGYLLEAEGGTFYLDNVDSLSLETQAKLLRVIETQRVRPLGSSVEVATRVRYMASTQRDLKELCARGEFRSDLYFRLAGICVHVPPLRERSDDVHLLLRHFQLQLAGRPSEFGEEAIDALRAYSWPGNVRELESLVRRAALTSEGVIGRAEVMRMLGFERDEFAFPRWVFEGRRYEELVSDLKREYLLYLFDRCDGNLDRVAAEMGTTKRNVYLRFSQAGLKPVDLRTRRGS